MRLKHIHKLVIAAVLLLTPFTVFATAQQPDILVIDGKSYPLYANPLEDFYKSEKSRPRFQIEPNTWSSGNWRGYVASWAIEDKTLFLIKINSWICSGGDKDSCRKVELKNLFGERVIDGKVKATWVSGDLKVPDGKLLQYVHMGYGSVYERELYFRITAGKLEKEWVVSNTDKNLPSEMELQRQELEKMKPKPKPQ